MTLPSAKCLIVALVLFAADGVVGPAGPGTGGEPRGDRAAEPDPGAAAPDADAAGSVGRGGGSPTYLGRGGYPPPPGGGSDLVAQLLSRVDALEEQVRQLRGRIDETQNQVQRQGAELGKRIDDMAFQAQNPQVGAAARPGPAPCRRRRRCLRPSRRAIWR